MFSTFGNTVKIKETPETNNLGLSGRIGIVYGETTPSILDVEVIGELKKDYALNVFFKDTEEMFWFTEDLLENIDSAVGSEIKLDNVNMKWIKNTEGNWIGIETIKKKWWKFWTR